MNMKGILILCGLLGLAASFVWAGVNLNEIPEKVVLEKNLGSRIDGNSMEQRGTEGQR